MAAGNAARRGTLAPGQVRAGQDGNGLTGADNGQIKHDVEEMAMPVRVQTADFDLSTEVAALRAGQGQVGAVVAFVGTVRDMNEGSAVSQMELEHYPGMTEQALEDIILRAKNRWPLLDTLIIHRIGPMLPQEQIVLVAVTAKHRGEAFAACEFIMDYLKTEAPFWKKEQTPAGARWVDARVSDDHALAKWGGFDAAAGGPVSGTTAAETALPVGTISAPLQGGAA